MMLLQKYAILVFLHVHDILSWTEISSILHMTWNYIYDGQIIIYNNNKKKSDLSVNNKFYAIWLLTDICD